MKGKLRKKRRYNVWVKGDKRPMVITAHNPNKAATLAKTSYPGIEIDRVEQANTITDFNYLINKE
jgi:hypothetical protein